MARPAHPCYSFTLPLRVVSETNQRGHWSKTHRRRKAQRTWATLGARHAMGPSEGLVPSSELRIVLARIAPRSLDDDNLRGALKAVRDGLADYFGVDDADPRMTWDYEQRRGRPKEYAVHVTIQKRECTPSGLA